MITLISDIDGTLLGDEYGQHAFLEYMRENRQHFFLVYATGRDINEFNSAVRHEGLILPDAAVINTGADIFATGKDGLSKNSIWHKKIAGNWHKERTEQLLKNVSGISSQAKSNDFKLSYYVDSIVAEEVRKQALEMIYKAGLAANIILSHGVYMDVLPEGCDKGKAAAFLLEMTGNDKSSAIVAGDSENDFDLFGSFSRGIVVGNALEGLKNRLKGSGFYHAKAHYGEGVVEGLKYYIQGMKI